MVCTSVIHGDDQVYTMCGIVTTGMHMCVYSTQCVILTHHTHTLPPLVVRKGMTSCAHIRLGDGSMATSPCGARTVREASRADDAVTSLEARGLTTLGDSGLCPTGLPTCVLVNGT